MKQAGISSLTSAAPGNKSNIPEGWRPRFAYPSEAIFINWRFWDTTGPQIGIVIPGVKVELRAEIQKLGCAEGLTNKIYRLETAIV